MYAYMINGAKDDLKFSFDEDLKLYSAKLLQNIQFDFAKHTLVEATLPNKSKIKTINVENTNKKLKKWKFNTVMLLPINLR